MKRKLIFKYSLKGISLLALSAISLTSVAQKKYAISERPDEQRVDITVDGKPFTSYIYPDDLMKPILYPLRTSKGTLVTRGWPLDPRPGERVDHPHHVGMWFNYGNVNGLDFWNNSTAIPEDKKKDYGTIKHVAVKNKEINRDGAILEVEKDWQTPEGKTLISETTKYTFSEVDNQRSIEMDSKLTAQDEDVSFADNKEGLLGIRIARELEHPSKNPEIFTDANGNPTKVAALNNDKVTGKYRSSEGIEGDNVWGTRAHWVNLMGKINNEPISILILDNNKNIGYPTYWHARGYGLFAANPLGQKEFSKGKETLNFNLKAGESVNFKYKVIINSGSNLTDNEAFKAFNDFVGKQK